MQKKQIKMGASLEDLHNNIDRAYIFNYFNDFDRALKFYQFLDIGGYS